MNAVDGSVQQWLRDGERVAIATVLRTWGSAPRKAGAKMAVTGAGEMSGSVSGGCVESAVAEEALNSLSSERPILLEYGVSDESAWEVGLACGGRIEILVEPIPKDHYEMLSGALRDQTPAASLVITSGPEDMIGHRLSLRAGVPMVEVSDFNGEDSGRLRPVVQETLQRPSPRWIEVEVEGSQATAFIEPVPLKPELLMVGGVHIAIALATIARVLGYWTIVIDPRRSFGSRERFSHADRLIQAWPGEAFEDLQIGPNSAVAVLTHDPKVDDPALIVALQSEAYYVGALGSRRTQAKRIQRLQQAGLTSGQLEKLHGPIGLDIGAQDPEEIALAIMAEIVAARRRSS